jgi:3-methyladenine DNA glycosylase/8-oxoguanine DNA glycosylase
VPRGFRFAETVESHGWYRLAPFQWQREEGLLTRREVLGGRSKQLEIRCDGLSLLLNLPLTAELRSRLTRMFQLHVDLGEFFVLARGYPTHQWVEQSGFGRLLCGATLFEDIVKIIATTNVTWSQTVRMTALFVETCGNKGAFPSAEEVVRFSADELQEECRLGYRAKSIHALARGIVEGTLDLDAISDPAQTTQELFASYETLPGIGPYGAAHLLAMDGRHDFIAVDTEFRRFVRERYHSGRKVADKTLLRRYAKWGRWKYLAYWSELWNDR